MRELRNEVKRAVILAEGPMVELWDLSTQVRGAGLALAISPEHIPFELELMEVPRRGRSGDVRGATPLVEEEAPPAAAAAAASGTGAPIKPYGEAMDEVTDTFRRRYFRELHSLAGGNISAMARIAEMKRHHVRAHLKKLGIP